MNFNDNFWTAGDAIEDGTLTDHDIRIPIFFGNDEPANSNLVKPIATYILNHPELQFIIKK